MNVAQRKLETMPNYLVERFIPYAGELTAVELDGISQQSLLVQQSLDADIQWLQMIVTADKMICLYHADSMGIIEEHARRSGLPVQRISEVAAIIDFA